MWTQVLPLVGVVLGATGSFITTTLLERAKSQRAMAIRWDDASHQAFSDYLKAVVGMARMAGQAARAHGWDDNAASRDVGEALRLMEEREDARSAAFELVRLVADKETIDAANWLNETVWKLEWLASDREDGSAILWEEWSEKYLRALDDFHKATRARLAMLVPEVDPRVIANIHYAEEPGPTV